MYSVTVSHHCMIAHSLVGAVRTSAALRSNFVVEAELRRALDADGIVCDVAVRSICEGRSRRMITQSRRAGRIRGRNATTEDEIHRRLAGSARGAARPTRHPQLRVVLRDPALGCL